MSVLSDKYQVWTCEWYSIPLLGVQTIGNNQTNKQTNRPEKNRQNIPNKQTIKQWSNYKSQTRTIQTTKQPGIWRKKYKLGNNTDNQTIN